MIGIALSVAACGSSVIQLQPQSSSELPLSEESNGSATEPEYYVLGAGDRFRVQIFNEPDLSGEYLVDFECMVSFPLIGGVSVAGLNADSVADVLRGRYSEYLKKPRLSVSLTDSNSKRISIFGLVKKPGTFPYEAGMTIVQAITLAGGFEGSASGNATYVSRKVNGSEQKFQVPVKEIGKGAAKNLLLIPGDVIYVPESTF